MINRIRKLTALTPFIADSCDENGVGVVFDEKVERAHTVIIKVDRYYQSLKLEKTPAAPDCLIVRLCKDGGFGLTIVEMKKISSSKRFNVQNLQSKFKTCLDDFLSVRFSETFEGDFKDVKLYFVSEIEVHKRDLGLKMETLINAYVPFGGKNYLIRPFMPNPAIKNCY